MDTSQAVNQVRPSIVQIGFLNKGFKEKKIGPRNVKIPFFDSKELGTGFIVNSDGYVITARHMIDEGRRIAERKGLKRWWICAGLAERNTENNRGNFMYVDCDLVDEDNRHDLALLKLRKNPFKGEVSSLFREKDSLLFGIAGLNPNRPKDGALVGISGYPLGEAVLVTNMGWMATSWSFSLKSVRPPEAPEWFIEPEIADVYLADVEVNPGNSGGPVYLVEDATVIGVCIGSKLAPVRDRDGNVVQNRFYSSGLTIVVPTCYVIELLNKQGL